MNKFVSFLVLLVALTGVTFAQNGSRTEGGRYFSSVYNGWTSTIVSGGSSASGTYSIVVNPAMVTLVDGRNFIPYATSAPLLVGSGSTQETAVPTAVSGCSNSTSSGLCTITAVFTQAHLPGEPVRSGTFGIQEAINEAKGAGGVVTIEPGNPILTTQLQGTATSGSNVTASTNVTLEDMRTGSVVYFRPNGTAYQFGGQPAASLGAFQGTTAVPITDTAFHTMGTNQPIPALALSAVGKRVRIHGDGVYTTAAASLLNAEVSLCTVSGCASGTVLTPAGCTFITTNQANVLANAQFSFDCTLTDTTAGATGTVMAKGQLCANLAAATTGAFSCFGDTATAASAAVDLTVIEFVQPQFKFSSSNAGNSVTLQSFAVEIMN